MESLQPVQKELKVFSCFSLFHCLVLVPKTCLLKAGFVAAASLAASPGVLGRMGALLGSRGVGIAEGLATSSCGLVVMSPCSSREATMLMGAWCAPAKNIASPTFAPKRSCFSPSER